MCSRRELLCSTSLCILCTDQTLRFGGEGIASGIRDAHQLSWRIALAERTGLDERSVEKLLTAWMVERRQGIKNAADFTRLNGTLCNEPESWGFWLFRNVEAALKMTPIFRLLPHPRAVTEARGYCGLQDGWFLPGYNGGGKCAQIYVEHTKGGSALSDQMLHHEDSLLTLVILQPEHTQTALDTLRGADLPQGLLSQKSVIVLTTNEHEPVVTGQRSTIAIKPLSASRNRDVAMPKGYRPETYSTRLSSSSNAFAVVRPDFYIFALVRDVSQLMGVFSKLKVMGSGKYNESWPLQARL